MFRQLFSSVIVGLTIAGIGGCGSPFLHPASPTSTLDPGLVGEWASSDPMQIRAVIAPPSPANAESAGGGYNLSLTVHDKGEVKTSLHLDMMLTEIGGARYVDLFLARPERDKLVGRYGFLVIPVHQVMKVARDGDTLTVWHFYGDWLDEHPTSAVFARERVTVGGGDVALVTAPTNRIRELLAQHGSDPKAFSNPIVFHRVPAAGSRQ